MKLAKDLIKIAQEILADKTWSEGEWKDYKKEHPGTHLHPKIEKAQPGVEQQQQPQQTTQPAVQQQPVQQPQQPAKPAAPQTAPAKPNSGFFKHEDVAHLPVIVKQKGTTKEEIFKAAAVAQKEMESILDSGSDFEKNLGLTKAKKNSDGDFDLSQKGPILILGNLKSAERAAEKVQADYSGDWSRMSDLVRATVAVDTVHDITPVLEGLKKSGLKIAKKPKDRFAEPTDLGYRDILLNVQYPNGHIGEIQLNVKGMIKAKSEAHKLYETLRTMEGNAKNEKREFTPEEQEQYNKVRDESKKIYDDAWSGANKSASMKKAADKKPIIRFFNYHDIPAMREGNKFPQLWVNGDFKKIHSLFDFDHDAFEISHKELTQLVKENKQHEK